MSNLLGKGLIDGLVVTAKNFVGSYFDGNRKERMFTWQYPEERMRLPENSRSFPFLVYDGTTESIRCTACKICEMECPPQCIYIVKDSDANGKPLQRPLVFDIDISVCMQCGICAEVCPFNAVKMDCDFECSKHGRFEELIAHLPDLLKSNEYYHQIKSAEAARVDAKRKPVKTPSLPPVKPALTPSDILAEDEQQAWQRGYQGAIGIGEIVWPPVVVKKTSDGTVPEQSVSVAPAANDVPWHDSGLDIEKRMEMAQGRPLADKLMAAMAHLDCHACGYDCRGYANALVSGETKDCSLCVPGADETKDMLEKLLKQP